MNITTKKAHIILGYMPKTQLSKYLNISRSGLYAKLIDNKWKEYQIHRIDYIYNKIENSKGIKKICFENKKICIYFEQIKKVIYPI